jgi:hypothetical protein
MLLENGGTIEDFARVVLNSVNSLKTKPYTEWRMLSNEWKILLYVLQSHDHKLFEKSGQNGFKEIMTLAGELISNCKDNQLVLHLLKILGDILKTKEEGSRIDPPMIVGAFAKHIASYSNNKRKEDYELIMSCTIQILEYCTKDHKETLKICSDNIIYGLNSEFNEYTQHSLALQGLMNLMNIRLI